LYRAPRGPQLAARVCAIALSIVAGLPTVTTSELELTGATIAVCALSRVIDHLLFGPLPDDAGGPPPARPTTSAPRLGFALAYSAVAGWGLSSGLPLDPIRAIWVPTTTRVVMQADAGANYRRIVGRIAGTGAGVTAALALTAVLHTPLALCAAMV